MRPRGEVAEALLKAAKEGPATVRELCRRARVAYGAGRYTASRLVARGDLVAQGEGRPAVLALPEPGAVAPLTMAMMGRLHDGT